ncbi:Protein of unknown function [Cotesia congregata]|uniref:Uncharacterized protein n=1 Tax=Cotesia congregata TaxID=51543 RepID=A0A8J2H1F6_COTCN|nr:Protein of unknown function [Cotesia congregata]
MITRAWTRTGSPSHGHSIAAQTWARTRQSSLGRLNDYPNWSPAIPNAMKMCKLFSISQACLSFSTNNSNLEEEKDLYELNLSKKEPDVVKFVEDGWKKLLTQGNTRETVDRGGYDVKCAKVQVADTETRYTIVVRYSTISRDTVFDCKISVMTTQMEPLNISCIVGQFTGFYDPAEYEHYNAFSVYNC